MKPYEPNLAIMALTVKVLSSVGFDSKPMTAYEQAIVDLHNAWASGSPDHDDNIGYGGLDFIEFIHRTSPDEGVDYAAELIVSFGIGHPTWNELATIAGELRRLRDELHDAKLTGDRETVDDIERRIAAARERKRTLIESSIVRKTE